MAHDVLCPFRSPGYSYFHIRDPALLPRLEVHVPEALQGPKHDIHFLNQVAVRPDGLWPNFDGGRELLPVRVLQPVQVRQHTQVLLHSYLHQPCALESVRVEPFQQSQRVCIQVLAESVIQAPDLGGEG